MTATPPGTRRGRKALAKAKVREGCEAMSGSLGTIPPKWTMIEYGLYSYMDPFSSTPMQVYMEYHGVVGMFGIIERLDLQHVRLSATSIRNQPGHVHVGSLLSGVSHRFRGRAGIPVTSQDPASLENTFITSERDESSS